MRRKRKNSKEISASVNESSRESHECGLSRASNSQRPMEGPTERMDFMNEVEGSGWKMDGNKYQEAIINDQDSVIYHLPLVQPVK